MAPPPVIRTYFMYAPKIGYVSVLRPFFVLLEQPHILSGNLECPEVVGVEAVDDVLRQDLLLLHPVPLVHDELNAEDCETLQLMVEYALVYNKREHLL